MKKLITLLLALAMVLSLAACGSKDNSNANNDSQGNGDTPTAATYKIKLGTTGNEEHQSTIAANFFKEKVEELTNGAVTVEIYPNSQLGSEREMAEGVKLGTLEMTIVTTDGTLPAWVPETQVLSIPYLLTSKEVAYEVLDNTLQPYFAPLFEAQGFKHLAFCELGFRHFTTNKREITCAADMKGQSIRVQEAPIWFALTDCLGATATPVAFNELYTALSQGMVDGQENPIPSIASSKFYEVQKYMCLDGHTYGAESILINLDYYNNLPAEIQTAIDEAAVYAGEQQRAAVSANEAAQLQQIKDAGVIVCEDPDMIASKIDCALVQDLRHEVDPFDPISVSIGAFSTEGRYNIVCEHAALDGTVRSTHEGTREYLHRRIREIAEGIARTYGGEAKVEITKGYGVVDNDPRLYEAFAECAKRVIGADNIHTDIHPSLIGEDMYYYGTRIPILYFHLGSESQHPLHSNQYLPKEACIETGIDLMTEFFLSQA